MKMSQQHIIQLLLRHQNIFHQCLSACRNKNNINTYGYMLDNYSVISFRIVFQFSFNFRWKYKHSAAAFVNTPPWGGEGGEGGSWLKKKSNDVTLVPVLGNLYTHQFPWRIDGTRLWKKKGFLTDKMGRWRKGWLWKVVAGNERPIIVWIKIKIEI